MGGRHILFYPVVIDAVAIHMGFVNISLIDFRPLNILRAIICTVVTVAITRISAGIVVMTTVINGCITSRRENSGDENPGD